MAVGGRADTRRRFLRNVAIAAGALLLLALILFVNGHWILGIIVGALAVVAIWLFMQTRTVR